MIGEAEEAPTPEWPAKKAPIKAIKALPTMRAGSASSQSEPPRELRKVQIGDVDLSDLTYQLRVEMRLGDLTQSLAEAGQIEPVHLIGPAPYKIIDGFRRCTAAMALGWVEIEAIVHDAIDHLRAFGFAFTHNVVRKNLRPIDKANAIRLAMKAGLSKHDAAVALTLSEKQVGRYLALLKLPRDVQEAIDEKEFTMAHALVLTEFDVGNVIQTVADVKKQQMSVTRLRRSLRCALGTKKPAGRPRQFVARDGDYIRFRGDFLVNSSRSDRDRLAEQLIQVVAFLQRPTKGGDFHRPNDPTS